MQGDQESVPGVGEERLEQGPGMVVVEGDQELGNQWVGGRQSAEGMNQMLNYQDFHTIRLWAIRFL